MAGPELPGTSPMAPQGPSMPMGQGGDQQFQVPAGLPMNPPDAPVGPQPMENNLVDQLNAQISAINLAENLDEEELAKIGAKCKQGLDIDEDSREHWVKDIEEWLKLATMCREEKTFPWPDASNVKYPLLATAAMQFSARAYPSLVPANGQLVHGRVWGKDPDGSKNARATRVSRYMSYQLSVEMEDWEDDMDRLLMQLSVTGNMYKKTWFDADRKQFRSDVISAADLIVNYWTHSLETAERISHKIPNMYPRVVKNLQRRGIYRDVELGDPVNTAYSFDKDTPGDSSDLPDTIPYEIVEQHTFLDLDDDGYMEPYVVTFDRGSSQVLRIVARFELDQVEFKDDKIVHIEPTHYFTKYGFVPNPDGSFMDLGFGHLLGPTNESVNTIVNQLIDSGTQNNLQSGFISRGLKIRGGNYDFVPGEWKTVNTAADDMRKQILPLPTKEPSQTLLKLMELLIVSGKELASVAEIFVGKMPGQNTPATTTMASIEQGMKVFTAIYKRVYKSLNKEYRKLFALNRIYIDPYTESVVLDEPIGPGDFDDTVMYIVPSADPTSSSAVEAKAKAQELLQYIQLGLDPVEVLKRLLIAGEHPNWERLIPGMAQTGQAAGPPPDPKVQEMQMKMQAEQEKNQAQAQRDAQKHELEMRSNEAKMAMEQQQRAQDFALKQQERQAQAAANEHKTRSMMAQNDEKVRSQRAMNMEKERAAKAAAAAKPKAQSSKK